MSHPAKSVSIVIPTLNAAPFLPALFAEIKRQVYSALCEIILVDSGSQDLTHEIAVQQNVRIIPLSNFSHGRARNIGVGVASGEIVVFLSQDALPLGNDWLSNLIAPFSEQKVAAVYSRQVPREGAIFAEQFFLGHLFPAGPRLYRKKDPLEHLTFTKAFFSNVSSAIRKSVLLKHPFDEGIIMSEDQQFSKDVLEAGYWVVYCPESIVIHSHEYTLKTVFQRYFDSAYSLRRVFPRHNLLASSSIGQSYLVKEIRYVIKEHPQRLPYYCCYTAAKVFGTLLAHCADFLPGRLLRHFSLHKYYWDTARDA